MLRRADKGAETEVDALWRAPGNARWIEPPEEGEIAQAIADGHAFLWRREAQTLGFAVLTRWVAQVYGLKALAVTRQGEGRPLLDAVLTEVFEGLGAHRVGFDVTADNQRALRLYERAGFTREGLIRECWQRGDGEWIDCALLGMLRREWRA